MSQDGVYFSYGQAQYVPNFQQFTFHVNMFCQNCPPVVEAKLKELAHLGVIECQISLDKKEVVVKMDVNKISTEQVIAKISEYTEASLKQPERNRPNW